MLTLSSLKISDLEIIGFLSSLSNFIGSLSNRCMDCEKSFLAFPHQTLQGSIGSLSNRCIDDEKALLGLLGHRRNFHCGVRITDFKSNR